jgi:hypothetical protein
MKVNLDDPNLTAFALGELSPDDHAKMAEAVAASPEHKPSRKRSNSPGSSAPEYEVDCRSRHSVRPCCRMEEERRASRHYQWGSAAAALASRGDRRVAFGDSTKRNARKGSRIIRRRRPVRFETILEMEAQRQALCRPQPPAERRRP